MTAGDGSGLATPIDPGRHPLLHSVVEGARWAGKDGFPGSIGPDIFEEWLRFIDSKGELGRFSNRLRTCSTTQLRDETFVEIGAAHLLEVRCGLPIIEWEPPGAGVSKGEFLVALPDGRQMFVEVKSPGWESEVIDQARTFGDPARPPTPARLEQPKFIGGEAFWFAPDIPVLRSIEKAYPKMLPSRPTLLIVFDDLRVPLQELLLVVSGVLYEKAIKGAKDPRTGKDHADGPFSGPLYERLGALGILNYGRPALQFTVFRNPRALGETAVPAAAFPGFDVYESVF